MATIVDDTCPEIQSLLAGDTVQVEDVPVKALFFPDDIDYNVCELCEVNCAYNETAYAFCNWLDTFGKGQAYFEIDRKELKTGY